MRFERLKPEEVKSSPEMALGSEGGLGISEDDFWEAIGDRKMDELSDDEKGIWSEIISKQIEKELAGLGRVIRGGVLLVGLFIMGSYGSDKLGEWRDLEEKSEWAAEELARIHEVESSNRDKLLRIDELFGARARQHLGISEKHKDVVLQQRNLERQKERFPFSGRTQEIEWGYQSGAEDLPEGFEASDFRIAIGGLPDTMVIPEDVIIRTATETFPTGWVEGEISGVFQSPEKEPMSDEYGLGAESQAFASFYVRSRKIVFHEPSINYSLGETFKVLGHEIGHGNDWETDREMTDEERVDLLFSIGERIGAYDRHRSSYVEDISNEDKQLERYKKAQEYWAEICEAYFSNPSSLHYKDFILVHDRVRQTDADFDVSETSNIRREVSYASMRQAIEKINEDEQKNES